MTDILANARQLPKTDAAVSFTSLPATVEHTLFDLCSSLLITITEQTAVRERTLLDFSRLVVQTISVAIEELPSSFFPLYECLLDYWRYQVRKDPDPERVLSYVRVYQLASLLNVYSVERKQEAQLQSQRPLHQHSRELIRRIYQTPGIPHSALLKNLQLSDEELRLQISLLEKHGYLGHKKIGRESHYVLSPTGIDLYQELCARRTPRVLPNHWSAERIFVLQRLLEHANQRQRSRIPVMTLVRKISECSEDDIALIAEKLGAGPAKHRLKLYSTNDIALNVAKTPLSAYKQSFKSLNKHIKEVPAHELLLRTNVSRASLRNQSRG